MPRAAPSSSSSASSSSDDGDDDGVDETLAAMSDDAINARVAPSFYALTRSIDREDRRAFHRVHSIARDAAFVEAQGERFLRDSTRAAFANARAGAWYAGGGGFAYAFLGLARRGASGEDDGSVMVRVVSRTAVLGICLLGVLSGFGMVHFPYTTVRIFHRAIPDAEVSGLERRLVQSVETIVERKKRIEILKYEIAREARMERDRNSKNGGGGSLFNRLAGGFRLPGLGEARGEQILAISAEIEALEMVNNTLFFDLHDVNLQRQRAKMSKTPYGRFLELCGVGMAVVCGYRLVAGFKRLIFKQTPTSDPISFALHIFLANKAIHIDPATLAQYLSLLLIAFLVINSMQNFITQLVKLFFAYGGGVTTDALVLFTTEMVGLYFLSSVLLVREQLPERYRHVVTEALGADLEFRFYAKFYELIFMASAALTAIALYAKHVTATVTADVSKPVRRA